MLNTVRRLFRRAPQPLPVPPAVTLRPIGVVRSGVNETGDWRDWREIECRILVLPEYADALLGLETYSHVLVLFWPHLVPDDVRGSKHRLHPRDDPQNPLQGILATRSQIRFNPVLVSAVRLVSVKGNVLKVRGLDAIDGTPVLDIKPYLPHFDSVPEATYPAWLTEAAERRSKAQEAPSGS